MTMAIKLPLRVRKILTRTKNTPCERSCSYTNPTSASTESAQPKETGEGKKDDKDDNDAKSTNLNTATGTETDDKKKPKATHTEFDPADPPAGVSITKPATTGAGTALYRVGDNITFGWNYTNLQGTPTAIDVLASCASASQTVTLTANMTFETNVNYVWDTNKNKDSAENPLLNAEYTLVVKDSDAQITDSPEAGYLGTYTGFRFGLYFSQPYVPLKDWKCTICSAASQVNNPAMGLATTMSILAVLAATIL